MGGGRCQDRSCSTTLVRHECTNALTDDNPFGSTGSADQVLGAAGHHTRCHYRSCSTTLVQPDCTNAFDR
jgi:hypothetical protein